MLAENMRKRGGQSATGHACCQRFRHGRSTPASTSSIRVARRSRPLRWACPVPNGSCRRQEYHFLVPINARSNT